MRKLVCAVVILALVAATVVAMADSTPRQPRPHVAGIVKCIVKDGDVLKSFTIVCPKGTCLATVTVVADGDGATTYSKWIDGKRQPATTSDIVKGAKVSVALTAAIADKAGTAKRVTIGSRTDKVATATCGCSK
jgi:hypothetical protein